MRARVLIVALAFSLAALAPASAGEMRPGATKAREHLSSQNRRRARVTVRPRRYDTGDRPLYTSDRRECRATFEERNIPQWGGRVLYAGQTCRWVR
jgi:hypothetical protein